ncbi:MAG TPA: S41 family peptidase [Cellvibrio sp.]|mgnify:CR=1 FL=1|nr:S41 family peptidase [Cellvibrio sp.]
MGVVKKLCGFVLVCLSFLSITYLAHAAEPEALGSAELQNPLEKSFQYNFYQDNSSQQKLSQEIIRKIEEGSIRKGALKVLTAHEIQNKFLTALDPSKIYFTKTDIAHIQQEYPITFKDIEGGKLRNVFKIYSLYQQALLAKNTYDLKTLLLGADKLDVYRGKPAVVRYTDWAESLDQREDRWSDLLAEDYLKMATQQQNQENLFNKLKERYKVKAQALREQTPESTYQAAMNALLSLYDERTQYISPVDSEKFNTEFNLVGIGIEFNIQDGYPTVVKTVEGAPAQGKLFPRDKITALSNDNKNFTELANLSLNKVFRLLKGEKESKVYLKVLPFSNPNTTTLVELTRKNLTLTEQEVSLEILNLKRENKRFALGVLRVPSFYFDFAAMQRGDNFYKSATRDAAKILLDPNNKSLDGLVVDLRDNGGGAFLEAANFFSLFQSKGTASYIKDMDGKISPQETKPSLFAFNKPLVVLVNNQSAGSAELFAAAVQDHQRSLVVGESTYGMGIVSSLTIVSSGSLKISMATLYTPKGQPINQVGIVPDISFPSAEFKSLSVNYSEQAIEVNLKAKKPKYAIESLKVKHLKRVENLPVFAYIAEAKKQSQQAEKDTVVLDMNHRLKSADQQRRHLENYAKELTLKPEDIQQQLRDAELQEAGEILVDLIAQ